MLAQGVYWNISSANRLGKDIAIKKHPKSLKDSDLYTSYWKWHQTTQMRVKQATAQLSGIVDSINTFIDVHVYLDLMRKTSLIQGNICYCSEGKGAYWEVGRRREAKPRSRQEAPCHRQLQTLKSSMKCTIGNTVMSYRSFSNSHGEQNIRERRRNCARRHDHHIIPGYWSGYQKYLAKSALCAENCASTGVSSLRSQLKQLQVTALKGALLSK